MLATAGAGVIHLGVTFEQIPMRIPPDHPAMIRAKATLPMSWALCEALATLGTNTFADRCGLFIMGFSANIAQAKGFHGVAR